MRKNSGGLKKVSINVTPLGVSSFKTLVKDILHGREMLIEPGLSIYILPEGTIFEFYDIGSHFPDYLFSHSKIVNSYQVPDLRLALEQLKKHGVALLGEIVDISASCCYCHVRFEDDSIIGLFQYNEEIA